MSTAAIQPTGAYLSGPPRAAHGVATGSGSAASGSADPRLRLRLTRRGRVALTTLVSVPLVIGALVWAVSAGGAAATGPEGTAHFEYVTVHSGESLWAIAEEIAPNADPRNVIADLISLNQLQGGVVTPGERLAVPAQYAK